MKKISIYIAAVFMATTAMAQTLTTIEKPEQGQPTYIVSSSDTLEATTSITLGPGTHIQSGATFTATIVEQTTATDPYTPFTFSDENYVFTRSFQEEMSSFNAGTAKEGDVIESIAYFDGLGRPMQQVGIKSAPDKEDILTHMEYDDYGRMEKEWLPYHEPSGVLGTYRGDKASATRSYYKTNYGADFPTFSSTTANAYSEKEFEASPLNRVLKQAAPGEDWALGEGNEIEFEYATNALNEVRLFEVTTSFANNTYTPTLVQSGYYGVEELYKTVTKDENHSSGTDHTTEEFTDKLGRVVLKRTHNSGEHDTYYVYDDFGNLTYVIPPKVTTASVSGTELSELCYQYKYDHRNRLVEKKLPGKGWESIVYNKLDQPVLTQDSNQDGANEWLFTKYDAFGRVAYTGKISNSSSRTSLQTSASSNTYEQYEERTTGFQSLGGINIYYSNDAIPQGISDTYTINYYDGYVDTDGLSVPGTVLGQTTASNVKGLATVSKVRVLGTSDWTTTITGYDEKGRPVYTASRNDYLGTTDVVETQLDFGGKVVQTKATHTKDGNSAIVTVDDFTYDHEGRLLRQKQAIGSQSQETLADNTYDELGQLEQKEVGGGLQTIDYTYNVRGWLKQINDPASLGSDLFAFGINYNTADHGGTALYNGNISETEWKTANDNALRWYRYGYDALNRIESATGSSTNYSLTNVDYDKNGNITALARNGHTNSGATSFGTMDNLVYTYDSGNKLTKVLDNGNDTYGFVDGTNTTTEYTYDTNGNMLRDLNKGMTADMGYNHLNLPTSVSMPGGTISYIYDAVGTKLKKTAGSSVTEYAGNYIYENGNLKQITHAEGYIKPDGSSWQYVYRYRDIWKNTRLTYADENGDGSVDASEIRREQNYYPFGLEHKGYNNVLNGVKNDLKTYQGQEFTEDLGLNTHEWRYRISDPATGRFWQIDPLAENYVYNSTYAFQENKLGMGVELEGLEFVGWDILQAASMDAVQNPNGVGAHTIGVAQGLQNAATDVVNAVSNPLQTLQGAGNTAIWAIAGSQFSPAIDNALGTNATATGDALMNSVVEGGDALINGNGQERGQVLGGMLGAALGTKGATTGLKALSNTFKTTQTTSLFRAVSNAELKDISSNGLRNLSGQFETGKLFTNSAQNASQFGKFNFKFDSKPFTTIEVKVPNSVMKNTTSFTADGMPAFSIPANQLPKIPKSSIKPLDVNFFK